MVLSTFCFVELLLVAVFLLVSQYSFFFLIGLRLPAPEGNLIPRVMGGASAIFICLSARTLFERTISLLSAEDLLKIDLKKIGVLSNRADLPSLPRERLDLLLKEFGFD